MSHDLSTLLARVVEATGPSEELDAKIRCVLAAPPGSFVERSRINGAWCIYTQPHRLWEPRDGWYRREGWAVTSSLDAALSLAERVLPGWKVSLFIGHLTGAKDGSGARAELHAPGRPKQIAPQDWKWPKMAACYYAPTPALAICQAILKAKIEEQAQEERG